MENKKKKKESLVMDHIKMNFYPGNIKVNQRDITYKEKKKNDFQKILFFFGTLELVL